MNRALDVQVAAARAMGLDVSGDDAKPSAMDSTCFESHHVSRHFERRKEEAAAKAVAAAKPMETTEKRPRAAASRTRSKTIKSMPKLSVAVACSCHLILAARGTVGMGSDHPHFAPLLFDAWRRAEARVMTADAGYDSDENHRLGRDEVGVETIIPALIGRPSEHPPTSVYRRIMREMFATATVGRKAYGQRWQVETVNSMVKRNLSSALRARTPRRRSMEMSLRCVVHNIMVLKGTEP
jgi:Transposase DDE domain